MFALAFDRRHKILLARFSGIFNSSDIAELDTEIVRFTSDHGPVHGILDFSAVVAVSVPLSKLVQRGRQPAISPACKRIIVAKGPELFELARAFTIQQGLAGRASPSWWRRWKRRSRRWRRTSPISSLSRCSRNYERDMPLAWKVEPADELVVAVAKGDVTRVEVERYLDSIVEGLALGFRKIFDVHEGDTSMTADDVLPLATRMRGLHEFGALGPLAVILPPGRGKRLQRAFGMLAVAKRPMRLFEEPMRAYSWISNQNLGDTATGDTDREGDLQSNANARALAARIRQLVLTVGEEAEKMRLRRPCPSAPSGTS